MHLLQIALENFRNYSEARYAFSAAGCLIIGDNGSGKTNLLEAIAYCGIGKSIRYHSDTELLRFGSSGFGISADFCLDSGLQTGIGLSYAERRKLLRIDNETIRNLSSLMERIKVIYCAPEDLNIISGSPRSRRQYFDLAVSQLFPEYIHVLHQYLHIVEQRNSLLKASVSNGEKRVWDGRFTESALHVISFRKRYLELMNLRLEKEYRSLSETIREMRIEYRSTAGDEESGTEDPGKFLTLLKSFEPKEFVLQRTLIGPHLDDYEFMLNDSRQKPFSSQGQKRVSVILIKLIQARLIEELTGIKPIMLFDDIFAELDAGHTAVIRDLIGDRYQVFITTPKPELKHIWSGLEVMQMGERK